MGWPLLPGGYAFHVQFAAQDAGAPKGVALSNALRGDVPWARQLRHQLGHELRHELPHPLRHELRHLLRH